MSAERLTLARLALSKLLEIYTPMNACRTSALDALRRGVSEFETAVREDERAQIDRGSVALDEEAIRADERAKVLVGTPGRLRVTEGAPLTPADPAFVPPPQVPPETLPAPLGNEADAPSDASLATPAVEKAPGEAQAPRKRK